MYTLKTLEVKLKKENKMTIIEYTFPLTTSECRSIEATSREFTRANSRHISIESQTLFKNVILLFFKFCYDIILLNFNAFRNDKNIRLKFRFSYNA